MALIWASLHADDYDAWKSEFDTDTARFRHLARGHEIFRCVEDPAQVSAGIELSSTEAARQLLPSLAHTHCFGQAGKPTVAELVDDVRY